MCDTYQRHATYVKDGKSNMAKNKKVPKRDATERRRIDPVNSPPRQGREKAVCVKTPNGKMWRFADGLLLKTIRVGACVDAPADLYNIGMWFEDAVSPTREKS